ncbi:LOW QUALITY PROTEIN: hypothetical protein Cgig2_000588 [Carnegiea gigantea]|uniref:Retrotransposon gag domain-containing protein n=1 Tax=Carnegiea gigantea TaxID=171969 RepID=A0A9Q1GN71_9CARY|nr:LOW QUALITY PROTEIN: hypothetical protein Cgig2_000588 [Carnegiea gigantea]
MSIEIGEYRERTKIVLLSSMPNIATAQAADYQRSQPRPRCRMPHTPNELLSSRKQTSRPPYEASKHWQTLKRRPNSECTRSPPRKGDGLRSILMEVRSHPMLKRPPSMTLAPKPYNAQKYCEFHKQIRHTTAECWEFRKALHELADKGQIDRFLKRVPREGAETSIARTIGQRMLHRDSSHYRWWIH